MKQTKPVTRIFAIACAAVALLSPGTSISVLGDDLFLLSTSVPPNVVLFIDNSNSMNQIEWHWAFDIDDTPAACDFDNNTMYDTTMLAGSETHCGNTRTIFAPENPTYWHGKYLNWYFSSAADPYINEIENALAVTASCNQAGSQTRFVQKYRRTRADAAKQVILDVLCLAEPRGIRFGLAEFREAEDGGDVDPNGGYISVAIADATPAHAADLEASVGNTKDGEAGPLAEAFFTIYSYYQSRTDGERVMSDMDSDMVDSEFPEYIYDGQGDVPGNPSQALGDPMQYSCQKAFVVMVTDGGPTYDTFDQDPMDTAEGYDDFMDLIGDYHDDMETEVPGTVDEVAYWLDDIVKFANENDFRPLDSDMPDEQTIDTYVVGFQTDDATNTYLEKVADVGNGLWFEVKDGDELSLALVAALNDIIEKSHSFTAATVPSARTSDGGDFYNSFFLPSAKIAFWEGHLRSWHIDAAGDVLDANGDCALDDPDVGECNSGRFKPRCEGSTTTDCVVPFWDAADEVPAPFSRNLLVSKVVSGSPAMVDFTQANMTATDLGIDAFTNSPPDQSPNSVLYSTNGSSALNAEGLADEVVAYALGCTFGTGTDDAAISSNYSAPLACEERPFTLGDIFHSDPLVIHTPRINPNLDSSYQAFRTGFLHRPRRIYAGTNAGFLESINAGVWDTSLDPDAYDEGTGAEEFGFMPWEARTNIRKLPIDFPTARTHYVDGSAQSANVWMYSTATVGTPIANGSEWRTLLVGGLRQGGHHYYALDVTNPGGIQFPTGTTLDYPGYQWEFPDESNTTDYANMGQTWGQPIVTRVKVKVGGNNNGGQGFDRWVAIVTAGYHEEGDPNPVAVTDEVTPTYVASSTKGRGIYILDAKTGDVIGEKTFKVASANCPTANTGTPQADMCFAIPSSPSVLDLNFDGYADVIYVGDLGGNLWKWVINDMGEDRANDSSNLRTQPSWTFRRLFRAPVTTISSTKFYRNIYFPPAASYVHGVLYLAFGTGERGSVAYEGDGTDDSPDARDENNRFYVMSDIDPYENLSTPQAELSESDLTDITGVQSGATITGRGFYFKAIDGEKFVTRTDIFTGLVIVSSFKPADTGDRCTSRGDATLYIFDLQTGDGYFTDGGGNPIRSTSIGSGFPTDPKVSIGVGGEDTRIFIEKSGADLESMSAPDVPGGGSYLYWREMN